MGRLPMSSRTTTSFVTFLHPFVLGDYMDELPPGTYQVTAEDEILRNHSFTAYRRTATHLLVTGDSGAIRSELRPIDHRELKLALGQDRACSNNLNNSEAALSPLEDQK